MTLEKVKQCILSNSEAIRNQLGDDCDSSLLPLYSSVDIRVNSVKAAVVDTNLFPAGFNNLGHFNNHDIARILQRNILDRVPACSRILILAENHTRNLWYLENVRVLQGYLGEAGFEVDVAAFLDDHPVVCAGTGHLNLKTATDKTVLIHCLDWVLRTKGDDYYDFVVLNNDLINGVPDALKKLRSPIYPSVAAGWHSRVKSHHFTEVNALMHRLADQFDFDPFFVTTAFESISDVDVFLESDRARLKDRAELMFDRLTMAYKLHEIDQKPLVFLKANKGTYGMGVVALESAQEILDFNRRLKNKLTVGKEGHEMCEFILQEGVPSSLLVNQQVAELCFYFSSHDYLGGFYRLNSQKSDRDNLNSRGMSFQTFSDSNSSADSRFMKEVLFYQFLGWVSVNAAHQEIRVLEDALR